MYAGYSKLERRHNTSVPGGEEYQKESDDIIPWSWDWSNECGSDALAAAVYVDSGVTRTAAALAGNVTSGNVTGLGNFRVTVTTAAGRVYQKTFWFVAPEGTREDDYGN